MGHDLAGKMVLVTGASGFLGRHTVAALIGKGARVRALARNPAKSRGLESLGASVVAGDMTDPASISAAARGCQVVFHFAGTTNEFKPRAHYQRVNAEGTRILAEAALKEQADLFVHISSAWVYGLWSGPGTCETFPCRESGQAYADTKLEAERVIRRLVRDAKLPAIILQPSEVYGPGDPNWTERPIELIRAGRMILAGGGKGLIQPIYIDDVVQGVLAAAERGRLGETYLLCGPEAVTFKEYFMSFARMLGKERLPSLPRGLSLGAAMAAEALAKLSRRPPVFTRMEVLSTTATATYDGRKAREELGFAPATSLTEGMRKVEDWLRRAAGPQG